MRRIIYLWMFLMICLAYDLLAQDVIVVSDTTMNIYDGNSYIVTGKLNLSEGFSVQSSTDEDFFARYEYSDSVNAARQVAVGSVSDEMLHERTIDFSIYPNPADQSFTLSGDELNGTTIKIVDLKGRQVFFIQSVEEGQQVIETTDFADGVYLVNVQTQKGGLRLIKLIVQH